MRLELSGSRRVKVSLTPLIDVVFILLLFFMLTTQFSKQQAMRIQLPDTDASVSPSQATDKLRLALLSDGRITVNGLVTIDSVELESFDAVADSLSQAAVVFVRAEDSVNLQLLARFIDRLSSIGFDQINMQVL